MSAGTQIYFFDRVLDKTILPLIPRWVTPNQVTTVRFISTPVVLWLLLKEYYITGLVAFLIVALTDAVDGAMARTRNQITDWGKLYDPVADKFLVMSTILVLLFRYVAPGIAFGVIAIELALITGAFAKRNREEKVREANAWGKLKMILQVTALALIFISIISGEYFLVALANIVLVVSTGFGLISLITYSI